MAESYERVNFKAPGIQLEGQSRSTLERAGKNAGRWSMQSASGELGRGVLLTSETSGRRYFVPLERIDFVELSKGEEKKK